MFVERLDVEQNPVVGDGTVESVVVCTWMIGCALAPGDALQLRFPVALS